MNSIAKGGALIALASGSLGICAGASPANASGLEAHQSARGIQIFAVQYDSGEDHSSGALNRQWIELANIGASAQMSGWTLRDTHGHVYHFGRYRFASAGLVRVHTGHGHNGVHNLYWGMGHGVWDHHGDTVTLTSASGAVVQRVHYSGGGSIFWCDGYHNNGLVGPWGPGSGVTGPGSGMPGWGYGGMYAYMY